MNKENYPLVSILIPNYNYERYLKGCLESVLNQTYPNYEVIFSDNGEIILTSDSDELRQKENGSIDEIFRRMFKC